MKKVTLLVLLLSLSLTNTVIAAAPPMDRSCLKNLLASKVPPETANRTMLDLPSGWLELEFTTAGMFWISPSRASGNQVTNHTDVVLDPRSVISIQAINGVGVISVTYPVDNVNCRTLPLAILGS